MAKVYTLVITGAAGQYLVNIPTGETFLNIISSNFSDKEIENIMNVDIFNNSVIALSTGSTLESYYLVNATGESVLVLCDTIKTAITYMETHEYTHVSKGSIYKTVGFTVA